MKARVCNYFGFSSREVGGMSMQELQSFYSAYQVLSSEDQVHAINAACFADMKKASREKIVQKLRGAKSLVKRSSKPASFGDVIKSIQGKGL